MNDRKSSPHDIQVHLQEQARGERPTQELVFDPATGELRLAPPGQRPASPDAIVVDQIAEDGFFARERP